MSLLPVLYVEDEPDDIFFMRYAWDLAGIPNPLTVIQTGKEAIHYLAGQGAFADREKHPLPCLLLLDLKLPGKSGFDVLRWVRESPALGSLKVVVVSGSGHDQDIALAQSLGVTDYLIKPSAPLRLVEIIQAGKDLWLPAQTEAKS
jgi:CheY-like chemotaxis protein